MMSICTKFLPATNHRGARIKAYNGKRSVTVGFHDTNGDPHDYAAAKFIKLCLWDDYGTWYKGSLPSGEGNVYVCDPRGASSYFNHKAYNDAR